MRPTFAVIALCALSGCGSIGGSPAIRSGVLANWDGLGEPPAGFGRPARKQRLALDYAQAPAEAAPLPGLPNPFKPYSKEWWGIEEQSARADDARLARLMVICKGCIVDRNLIPAIKRAAEAAEPAPSAHLATAPIDSGPTGEK